MQGKVARQGGGARAARRKERWGPEISPWEHPSLPSLILSKEQE